MSSHTLLVVDFTKQQRDTSLALSLGQSLLAVQDYRNMCSTCEQALSWAEYTMLPSWFMASK